MRGSESQKSEKENFILDDYPLKVVEIKKILDSMSVWVVKKKCTLTYLVYGMDKVIQGGS